MASRDADDSGAGDRRRSARRWPMSVRRALLIWLILAVVAVTAGVVREAFLTPRVGALAAHQVGTGVVVAAFALVTWKTVRWIVPDLERGRLVALGVGWTALTVVFEFAFGHWIVGHPWSRLLADYDLTAGRLWALVLLTMLVAPAILGGLRRRRA